MSQNEVGKSHGGVISVLFLGLAVAIGGNIYESTRRDSLARDLSLAQLATQRQITKLNDTTQEALSKTQQRFDALENQVQGSTTDANLRQLRSDVKKSNTLLADGMEQKRQQLLGQLADLGADTSEKLGRVSSDLQNTGADVKRVAGEVSEVTGAVATNAKELAALKALGERSYFEFDLAKTQEPQKIGDLRIVLKKTDPKHSRYTVAVLTDDKMVEKKDRTINEPVQLYISDSVQPYEIVVNEVKKDKVSGYVVMPKVKLLRGQTS